MAEMAAQQCFLTQARWCGGTLGTQDKAGRKNSIADTVHKIYAERTIIVADTFRCTAASITLSVYDNGEIDGDSVSVYVNDAPLVQHRLITTNPVTINLPVEKGSVISSACLQKPGPHSAKHRFIKKLKQEL